MTTGNQNALLSQSNNSGTDETESDEPVIYVEEGERRIGQMQQKNIKHNLLKYLKDISGKNIILGIPVTMSIKTVRNITGIHPGILNLTMPGHLGEHAQWQSFTEKIISNWNNGYFVRIAFLDGEHHPLEQLDVFGRCDDNWNDLTNDNGHLNQEWKKQLDFIVPYFQKLQDAGVVVICDLLPQINSISCLWGGRPGMSGSLKLYQLTHDYLTQKYQLHSLLWTWSFYISGNANQLTEFWPGEDYVDVVSVYLSLNNHLEMDVYQKLLEFVGDKPLSMEGIIWKIPKPAVFSYQPRWTWFTISDSSLKSFTRHTYRENVKSKFQNFSIIDKENNEFFKTLNSNP